MFWDFVKKIDVFCGRVFCYFVEIWVYLVMVIVVVGRYFDFVFVKFDLNELFIYIC